MSWILDTAARTLWQEARGEPQEGRQAVAHVMWNRVRLGQWGPNLATVCLWRSQFSGWLSADPNFREACILSDLDPMLQELKAVLINAQAEADPTNGATHYYAASMNPPPDWAATMTFVGQFGNQKFYRKGAALVA